MDNFFSGNNIATKQNTEDSNLKYEQIFMEASTSIRNAISKFKPDTNCDLCPQKKTCKIQQVDIFAPFPIDCKYRSWQLKAITYLSGNYRLELHKDYKFIMDAKNSYTCNKCGVCCKIAVNNNSFEQLKQRAHKGDKFAEDFVTIYKPYSSETEARQANPEYFDELNKLIEDDRIYYYYCTRLKNNLCSDYENRPNICRNFPNNPLKLLPKECAYNEWKKEIEHKAMLLKAKIDIIDFYKDKLK